jgi:hypothetical protein
MTSQNLTLSASVITRSLKYGLNILGISALLVSTTLLSIGNISAQAASAVGIPINKKGIGTLRFNYGNVGSNINLTNSVAVVTVTNDNNPNDNPAFSILSEGNFDIFNGDPSRPDDAPAPVAPGDCKSFDGPRYAIPSGFFTSTRMRPYGLQTAKTTAASTGILTQKSTGCIQISFRMNDNAKVGDRATFSFNWDAGPSPDLSDAQRPPITSYTLEVTEAPSAPVQQVVPTTQTQTPQAPAPVVDKTPIPTISVKVATPVAAKKATTQSVTTRTGAPETYAGIFIAILVLAGGLLITAGQKRYSKVKM